MSLETVLSYPSRNYGGAESLAGVNDDSYIEQLGKKESILPFMVIMFQYSVRNPKIMYESG